MSFFGKFEKKTLVKKKKGSQVVNSQKFFQETPDMTFRWVLIYLNLFEFCSLVMNVLRLTPKQNTERTNEIHAFIFEPDPRVNPKKFPSLKRVSF